MIRTLLLVSLTAAIGLIPDGPIARGDNPLLPTSPAIPPLPAGTVPNNLPGAFKGEMILDGQGFGPGTRTAYREKWAVIIGVNYAPEDRDPAWGKGPPTLANAETDATDVRDMLVNFYGYKPECIRFLTGNAFKKDGTTLKRNSASAATTTEIDNALGGGFLGSDQVRTEDNVLVFFSGHGFPRRDLTGTKSSLYLAPADMRMNANETPNFDHAAIKVEGVVEKLRDHCRAQHKLLILDCCFSASVFRIGVGMKGARTSNQPTDEGLFKQRGFQAITAGQENQRVLDGPKGGNSPFTASLLRSLAAIPQRGTGSPQPFTASELFRTIDGNLETTRIGRASPEYGWISGDQGEFFFEPAVKEGMIWPRQTRELDGIGQKQLLAIIPSTMGNWWADEMIWFMPSLRHEIVERDPITRSTEHYFDVEAIRRVALERATEQRKNAADATHYRYEHLDQLLRAKTVKEQIDAIDSIIKFLESRYPKPGAGAKPEGASAERALDLHYLAVLCHKRKRTTEAREYYARSLAEYENATRQKSNLRPLHALCQMDYGVLCQTVLNQFDEARSRFAQAREVVGANPPIPFVAFTLYKEAEAARRMGAFGVSDRRMKAACDGMFDIDRARSHPMTGAVLKYDAWAGLEQCRFDHARESFLASEAVFKRLLKDSPNSLSYQIELFHIHHGLAMIERFQGRDDEAIKQFRILTDEIAAAVQSLDGGSDLLPNFAEIRQLYADRYVNSVDRQGDCRLYGRIPDYAEAADDYRRSLRAVPYIPEDRRESITLDLLYRRAIALAMPSSQQNPVQNLTLAQQLCEEAELLEQHLKKKYKVYPLLRKTHINKVIARTLIRCPKTEAENELWNLIHPGADFTRLNDENPDDVIRIPLSTNSLDRDEVERLMFGCTLLLRNWKTWGLSEFDALMCCDRLLTTCRSATRPARVAGGQMDRGLLTYLRPFFDEAFQFKAELSPPPVKELVEIAWEATRGKSYRKSKEIAPVLVYYQIAPQGGSPRGYLLLDVTATKDHPGGITQCHVLSPEWCDETVLKQASTTGGMLPLPGDLSRTLAGLKTERPLECRWRDPVTGLGIPVTTFAVQQTYCYALGVAIPVPVHEAAPVIAEGRLPFNLSASLPANRYSDLADLRTLRLPNTRTVASATDQIPPPTPPLTTSPVRP